MVNNMKSTLFTQTQVSEIIELMQHYRVAVMMLMYCQRNARYQYEDLQSWLFQRGLTEFNLLSKKNVEIRQVGLDYLSRLKKGEWMTFHTETRRDQLNNKIHISKIPQTGEYSVRNELSSKRLRRLYGDNCYPNDLNDVLINRLEYVGDVQYHPDFIQSINWIRSLARTNINEFNDQYQSWCDGFTTKPTLHDIRSLNELVKTYQGEVATA